MPVVVPAVVIEAHAPSVALPVSSLREAERRAAGAYEAATSVRLGDLPAEPPRRVATSDPEHEARVARIEEALHAAREPLELAEREAVPALRVRVAVAYEEARAHPEDPEAPFLVGESLRTLARVEALAGDAHAADALRRRADLLDGGRVLGLSEGTAPMGAAPTQPITIVWDGRAAELIIDGERRTGDAVALAVGEHHLRVRADGVTLDARFFPVGEGTATLLVRGMPRPSACTSEDLAPALAALAKDDRATFGAQCARWARVVRDDKSLSIQLCGATSCAPPSTWSTVPLPTPVPVETRSWVSSKWTWISVGAAAVVGGTIAAWRLGAFSRDERPEPTWRWEGAR